MHTFFLVFLSFCSPAAADVATESWTWLTAKAARTCNVQYSVSHAGNVEQGLGYRTRTSEVFVIRNIVIRNAQKLAVWNTDISSTSKTSDLV